MSTAARATATFDSSSTARITIVDPVGATTYVKVVNPPPASGSMVSYSLAKSVNGTTGDASIGAVTTSTITGFVLAPGTGIAQANNVAGVSDLKIVVNGTWDISGSFGPTSTGYLSFTLAGHTGNPGNASVSVNLSFTDGNGNVLRSPFTTSYSYGSNTTFSQPVTSSVAFSPSSLGNGKQVKVTGTIDFQADPSEVTMGNFELTAAPPTSTYVGPLGALDVHWNDAANWSTDINPTPVPNGIGERARFVAPSKSAEAQIVNVDAPVTIGTVDLDEFVDIDATAAPLTFDVAADNAVLLVRNVQGNYEHFIAGNIVLNDNLEVENDSSGPLTLGITGSVSGSGGLIVHGLGDVALPTANSFTGGVTINSGAVEAEVAGSLGTGPVVVNGGLLEYEANGAAMGNVPVHSGGQVTLGVVPVATDEFTVDDLGCVSGDGTALAALSNTNLHLSPGAVIGHQTFDTNPAVNNPTNLGSTPLYNFGISNDFDTPGQANIITVGTNSNSPWIGFGSDLSQHTFGDSTTTATQQLIVSGDGQIFSLGNELVMNAPITGGGGTLTKRGAGLVSINSTLNSFTGPVVVQSGPMAVNGIFAPASILVQSGATLGGAGTIGTAVTIQNGGHLSPGVIGPTPTFADAPYALRGVGTLHVTSLTLNDTSQIDVDLGDTITTTTPMSLSANVAVGATSDLVVVDGNLVLDGVLNINDTGSFDPAGTYTLFTFGGTITNNGLIIADTVGLDPREQIDIIFNASGIGGSVVLEPTGVPEPTTVGLALLGTAGLLQRRRRVAA